MEVTNETAIMEEIDMTAADHAPYTEEENLQATINTERIIKN